MTVEQSPLPVRTGQRTREENLTLTLAKIKEITGASDHVIKEAIQACKRNDGTYKVEDVVTMIIGDDTVTAVDNVKVKNRSRQTNTRPLDHVDAVPGSSGGSPAPAGQKKSACSVSVKQATETEEYIDLTRDTQGILGGQISREEQDISRVLEASLAESKGSTKRKRGELWFFDPLNPHERRRQDGWPVGLKNVGNTCWFSAVIQSLFHLRKFRDLVLNYNSRSLVENEVSRNLRFVSELRQLFALMVGSQRKYVDPSKAVDILKEASSTAVLDGQQDVSEFQHKLLDWLEGAFNIPSCPSTVPARSHENPVHQLFQGKYKAEGFHEGKQFTQEVTFGQYPLNVVGFCDIHESLEATTAQGEIETVSGDSSQKSGQEIWFTHLPMVLTFELSRFGFNQQLNRAEKIHQQLSFPPVIYVDRYLECNKSMTRQKREEARKLKDELSSLRARLDKFMNYGSSNKRYPLPDVLQYALEFAESSPSHRLPSTPSTFHHPHDVEMESPVPCSRVSQDVSMSQTIEYASVTTGVDSISPQPLLTATAATFATTTTSTTATSVTLLHPAPAATLADPTGTASFSTCVDDQIAHAQSSSSSVPSSPVPEAKKFKDSSVQVEFDAKLMPASVLASSSQVAFASAVLQTPSQHPHTDLSVDPHPRSVSTEELRVLQDCLKRWREEVETDVRELQRNIAALENKLDGMYSEEYMKKFPYHLHAVLVHEGQAVSGHYWAFIYDDRRGKWLKFNDITVSESSLEEMHKESVGGFHNASAYCLMYIDRSRLEVGQGDSNTSATSVSDITSLPTDLRQIVEEDNAIFRQEILSWDEEQRRKAAAATASTAATATATASTMTPSSSSSSSTITSPSMLAQWRPAAEHELTDSPSPGQLRGRSGSDDQDVVCTGEQRPGEASIIRPLNPRVFRLAEQHAQLSLQATLSVVIEVNKGANASNNPMDIIKLATEREYMRLKGMSRSLNTKLPAEDLRLNHIVLYLLCSQADTHTTTVILSEQFSLCVLLDSATKVKGVRQQAHEAYKFGYEKSKPEQIECYEFWHRRYNHYRQAICMLSEGVKAYCADRFQEALPYLHQAWLHNCEPGLTLDNVAFSGINPQMLAYLRRSSLQKLNAMTLKSFESDDDMTDALTVMTQQILPSLAHISASGIPQDEAVVEEVRGAWCQFLEKDLSEEKIERLQDFLSKMFEGGGTVIDEEPKQVRTNDLTASLHERYVGAMRKLKEKEGLTAWMGTS